MPPSPLRVLIQASRPGCWSGPAAMFLGGFAASGVNLRESILSAVVGAALTLPVCLIGYGLNDVYDYDSDRQNPRKKRPWEDGCTLDRNHHRLVISAAGFAVVLLFFVALHASISKAFPELLGYAVASLILGWGYSAPPLRLKERPIIDSLSNGMMAWLIWACGYAYGGGRQAIYHHHGWYCILFGLGFHCMGAAIDIKPDTAAKHRTIGTAFGEKFCVAFAVTCFGTAMTLSGGPVNLVGFLAIFGSMMSISFVAVPWLGLAFIRYVIILGHSGMIAMSACVVYQNVMMRNTIPA